MPTAHSTHGGYRNDQAKVYREAKQKADAKESGAPTQKLGSPVVPFTLFLASGFPSKVTTKKEVPLL